MLIFSGVVSVLGDNMRAPIDFHMNMIFMIGRRKLGGFDSRRGGGFQMGMDNSIGTDNFFRSVVFVSGGMLVRTHL